MEQLFQNKGGFVTNNPPQHFSKKLDTNVQQVLVSIRTCVVGPQPEMTYIPSGQTEPC